MQQPPCPLCNAPTQTLYSQKTNKPYWKCTRAAQGCTGYGFQPGVQATPKGGQPQQQYQQPQQQQFQQQPVQQYYQQPPPQTTYFNPGTHHSAPIPAANPLSPPNDFPDEQHEPNKKQKTVQEDPAMLVLVKELTLERLQMYGKMNERLDALNKRFDDLISAINKQETI